MNAATDIETILVTGAGGQLGVDVVEVAGTRGHRVVGLGRTELDCTDATRVAQVVAELRPTAIIHCAAYTKVDDAEEHRDDAFAGNELATQNVVAAAQSVGAYLVGVSTDYVFPGTSETGYGEGDATAPINVYGASKLAGEHAITAEPSFAVARTAWLFGRTGTNFVRTIARVAQQRPHIDVVTDQVGSPTYTRHLAAALVAATEQRLAGVLHLAGAPIATWHEVAVEIVEQLGVECAVRPTTCDAFPRPAARPACSILRATRSDTPTVGDWRDGIREVLAAARPRTP